jgi:hypothetical protein
VKPDGETLEFSGFSPLLESFEAIVEAQEVSV